MTFYREMKTKDGRSLILRSAVKTDAPAYIHYFCTAHGETDFLTSYPEESPQDEKKVGTQLEEAESSSSDAEICAFVDGVLVGSAGIELVSSREKTRHRAEYGISILREYWSQGIGYALTEVCIALAKQAGYRQLELDVVADNHRAIALYEKFGFTEYGRNPRGFRNRQGNWQTLVLMRLELS